MSRIVWGDPASLYTDRGVLYLGAAEPWDGLVKVDEQETNVVGNDYYMESNRVRLSSTHGDLQARISAYTYPDSFAECCGYGRRQDHRKFGLSYRTIDDDGYKTHLLYSALVVEDKSDVSLFRWDICAPKILIPGAAPSASLTLEHVPFALEDALYGTETTDPWLPTPTEVIALCLQ